MSREERSPSGGSHMIRREQTSTKVQASVCWPAVAIVSSTAIFRTSCTLGMRNRTFNIFDGAMKISDRLRLAARSVNSRDVEMQPLAGLAADNFFYKEVVQLAFLRASREHILIVRPSRAGRAVGRSLSLPPSLLVVPLKGWSGSIPYCAHRATTASSWGLCEHEG